MTKKISLLHQMTNILDALDVRKILVSCQDMKPTR